MVSPGLLRSNGFPVCASTFADIASHIGLIRVHAYGEPLGISAGPKRAPTSPPETADENKIKLLLYFFSRATVSTQRLFPVSIIMSSGCMPAPIKLSETWSTGAPAGTERTMR